MTDWLSRAQRSRNMASIRSKGNKTTEQAFAKLLRSEKISGWRRHSPLIGKPDFAFRGRRLAVFIDGCFWHGCPRCYRLPEDNQPYWKAKARANRSRDKRNSKVLRENGWRVLRIWEHEFQNRKAVLQKLRRELRARS
jgi:DNA mismatch endonuclease (patch repair protein)